MRKLFLQVWLGGALALAALAACNLAPAVQPTPQQSVSASDPPSAGTMAAKVPPGAVAVPTAPASEPGYAGVWAVASADCIEPTKTYVLSRDVLKLTPQTRNCEVVSLKEEHPTGRSAIYAISAVCVSDPPTGAASLRADDIKLNFGASDTVMQIEVNSDPPLRLERCPAAPTP